MPKRPSTRRPPALQDTLRLSSRGPGMLLGELEHALMEAAWAIRRPATARTLHEHIVRAHPVELITAVTVLNRLVAAKRLLQREKIGDVFHYSPTLSKEEFMQQASRHVVDRVLGLGTAAVSVSFVDALADRDPEQLAELARLVRRKLRERNRE